MSRYLSKLKGFLTCMATIQLVVFAMVVTFATLLVCEKSEAQRGQQRFLNTRLQTVRSPGYATGPTERSVKKTMEISALTIKRMELEIALARMDVALRTSRAYAAPPSIRAAPVPPPDSDVRTRQLIYDRNKI